MPKEIKDGDMKTFLLYLRGDEKNKVKKIAKSITIKTKNMKTKFKLRCPKYVYTLPQLLFFPTVLFSKDHLQN